MGEQAFRTESSDHTTISILGVMDLDENDISPSSTTWSTVQDSDAKIPTAKAAQDRIDTISSSGGFEQKLWGDIKTNNGEDYFVISAVSNQADGTGLGMNTGSGNDYYNSNPRFYPFCMNKELTLKGINFKSASGDSGPVWICIWNNTNSLTNISNGPGSLVAYIKIDTNVSSFSEQTFIDSGSDGIVYNSSHTNTQVTIPVGLYWYSIHSQQNDAGNNSSSMFYFSTTNQQKDFYTGGYPGIDMGFASSSFGVRVYGLKYTNNDNSPTSDSWTPSSFTTASEFEKETSRGSYAIGFCML